MTHITESELRKKVRSVLKAFATQKLINEEDIKNYKHIDYGIYDSPHLNPDDDEFRDHPEEKSDENIIASPDASLQLTARSPSVGDPEYVPGSIKELQIAVHTVAEKVPESKITSFFRATVDLLEKFLDEENEDR